MLQQNFVRVACVASDPNQVLGYLVFGEHEGIKIVHYAYVKHPFRTMGICTSLLQDSGIQEGFYTHETPSGARVAARMKLIYNPYLAGVIE